MARLKPPKDCTTAYWCHNQLVIVFSYAQITRTRMTEIEFEITIENHVNIRSRHRGVLLLLLVSLEARDNDP